MRGVLDSLLRHKFYYGEAKGHPIVGLDEASSQLEAWALLSTVFLGYDGAHPAKCKIFLLLEETSRFSPRLRAQACHQPTLTAALLRLIQQEFNDSFFHEFERRQRVRWPNFESLRRALATGNFRLELVTLPAGMAPPELPIPQPLTTRRLAETP